MSLPLVSIVVTKLSMPTKTVKKLSKDLKNLLWCYEQVYQARACGDAAEFIANCVGTPDAYWSAGLVSNHAQKGVALVDDMERVLTKLMDGETVPWTKAAAKVGKHIVETTERYKKFRIKFVPKMIETLTEYCWVGGSEEQQPQSSAQQGPRQKQRSRR